MAKGSVAVVALKASLGAALALYAGIKIGQLLEHAGVALYRRIRRAVQMRQYMAAMSVPLKQMEAIRDEMIAHARGALAGEEGCFMPMLPTFVTKLPTGTERGDFFALDIGGTNFRVRHVSLSPLLEGQGLKTASEDSVIPQEVMAGSAAGLFDFMATRSKDFMGKVVDLQSTIPRVGFTFSFPMEQKGVNKGTLLRWTKGYSCADGIGLDPVEMLKAAFRRQGVEVDVPVLVNDTVALLAAAKMAVILGTGTNAAYMEDISNIPAVRGHHSTGTMAINTEWADFKGDSLHMLQEDRDLDRCSIWPGYQVFEKMVSGMHLGEVARRIIVVFAKQQLLWPKGFPHRLRAPYSLPTAAVSRIDDVNDTGNTSFVLAELGLIGEHSMSEVELRVIGEVCSMVGRRAARLSASGMLALMKLMRLDGSTGEAPSFTIAIDGGLYANYANFREHIKQALLEALGRELYSRITLTLVPDGSGVGAALLAANEGWASHKVGA